MPRADAVAAVAGVRAAAALLGRNVRTRVGRESRSLARSTREYRAELLVTLSFLAGWALVTHAIALLVPPRIPTWEISGGFLLLSFCGWKLVGVVFWKGLYKLTRKEVERG